MAADAIAADLIYRTHDGRALHATVRIGLARVRLAALTAVAGAMIVAIGITETLTGALLALLGRKFALPRDHAG